MDEVRKDIESYMLEMDERVSRLEKRAEVVTEELAKLRNLAASIVSAIEELSAEVAQTRRPKGRQPTYADIVIDEFLASGEKLRLVANEEIRTYPVPAKTGATLYNIASTFATGIKRAAARRNVDVNTIQRGENVLLLNEPPYFRAQPKRNGKKEAQ